MTTQSKVCAGCNDHLNLSEFHIDKKSADGLNYNCKKCTSKAAKKYRQSIDGFLSKIYSSQIRASAKRNMPPPSYTKKELLAWLNETPLFLTLFNEWTASGFIKNKIPSIDRIDDYKPYSFENISLVTWADNFKKACDDRKSGKNSKHSRPVMRLDSLISNKGSNSYPSINQAARETGINPSSINRACLGKGKKAGGYRWEFKEI